VQYRFTKPSIAVQRRNQSHQANCSPRVSFSLNHLQSGNCVVIFHNDDSQEALAKREYDPEIKDMANYIHNTPIDSELAVR
jgi:hypothetical protein